MSDSEANRWLRGAVAERLLRRYEAEILDPHHPTLPFWQLPAAVQPYALLAAFDSMLLVERAFHEPAAKGAPHFAFAPIQKLKNLEEGLSQAFRWLLAETVMSSECVLETTSAPDAINAAGEFLLYAGEYADVADFHISYGRKLIDVAADPDAKLIRFSYRDDSEALMAVFGMGATADELFALTPHLRASPVDLALAGEAERRMRSIPYRFEAGHVVIEDFSILTEDICRRYTTWRIPPQAYELEPAEDLGGFTVGQFDAFWHALFRWSRAAVELFACELANGRDQAECYPTQVVDEREIVEVIGHLSDLSSATLRAILDRLTLRPGAPLRDIFLQPFFCCRERAIWSAKLVITSRHQRNMLKLMARSRDLKSTADNLIGAREHPFLRELGELFANKGYQYKLTTPICAGEDEAEMDLLAWTSQAPDEILVIEGKSLLSPDEINEVDAATDALVHGQKRLIRAIEILRKIPMERRKQLFAFVPWERVRAYHGLVAALAGYPNNRYDHMVVPATTFLELKRRLRRRDFKSPARVVEAIRARTWLDPLRCALGREQYGRIVIGGVAYELPCVDFRPPEGTDK